MSADINEIEQASPELPDAGVTKAPMSATPAGRDESNRLRNTTTTLKVIGTLLLIGSTIAAIVLSTHTTPCDIFAANCTENVHPFKALAAVAFISGAIQAALFFALAMIAEGLDKLTRNTR